MLIAQISDVHVGGVRYKQKLLHAAIREINEAGLVGRHHDPFVRAQRGESLAND